MTSVIYSNHEYGNKNYFLIGDWRDVNYKALLEHVQEHMQELCAESLTNDNPDAPPSVYYWQQNGENLGYHQLNLVNDFNGERPKCKWGNCGYVFLNVGDVVNHLYFHAHQSRLEAIGTSDCLGEYSYLLLWPYNSI